MSFKVQTKLTSLILICTVSNLVANERNKRFSFSSLIPSFLNPVAVAEKPSSPSSINSLIPTIPIPGMDLLIQKEDRCKDPLISAVSTAVKLVLTGFMKPLPIPEVLKNSEVAMAGLIVEQSLQFGLTSGNIVKTIITPIDTLLNLIPFVGENLSSTAGPHFEKAILEILASLCTQINCCFD